MPSEDNIEFSDTVSKRLKYYVYRLIDPRNGETFYVGKGKGNRVFQHARDALQEKYSEEGDDEISRKMDQIRDIHNAHLKVIHVIHRHELSEEMALEVEAALIDAYPGVTNLQGGHGSGDRGPMHPQEIVDKYELPIVEPDPQHKLLLINVNRIEKRSNRQHILDQTRFAWRINKKRAQDADYVLAVYRGVVIGAFVAEKWLSATADNFKELGKGTEKGRLGFRGSPAPEDIWEKYVGSRGKRVTNKELQHIQNPIRYWQI